VSIAGPAPVVNIADWRLLSRRSAPALHPATPGRLCRLAFDVADQLRAALPASDALCRKARRLADRLHDAAAFDVSVSRNAHALADHGPFIAGAVRCKGKRKISLEQHSRLAVVTRFLELGAADARAVSTSTRGKSDPTSRAWRIVHEIVQQLRSDLHSRCYREHRVDGAYLVEVQ
jgi:hypothetical protein